ARVGAYDPVGGVHEQSGAGPADTDVGDVHGGRGTVFELGRRGVGRRAYRLVPGALGRDVHELAVGIAQCGGTAPEDTAGVQATSVVAAVGVVDGRVSVAHRGLASVVTGPGQTYR